MEDTISATIKSFWTFIPSLKKDNGLPRVMTYCDTSLATAKDITDAFAKHVQSCYTDYSGITLGP